MGAERWAISKRKWTINSHHHHNIIIIPVRKGTSSSGLPAPYGSVSLKIHIIINIARLKNPKIRKRSPILPFENNNFLQGRPPKISYNHQHRPIKNPKIRQRGPFLSFENNDFLQGRPRKFYVIINIALLKSFWKNVYPPNAVSSFQYRHFPTPRP